MDVVLDAGGLEVLHAGRRTSHDEHRTAIQILEGRDSVLRVLIIRRTDHHDVGTGSEGSVDTFLYGLEAEVINHLVTGTSQEVARELGTGLTHGQVTDGQHEGHRHLRGLLSCQAESLEVRSHTTDGQCRHVRIVGMLGGLDMVIDGHSHEVYNRIVTDKDGNQISVAQTGTKLQNIGQLTIYKDGRLEEKLIDTVPKDPEIPSETDVRKDVERYVDPQTKLFIDDIVASYDGIMSEKIGELSVDLIKMDEDGFDYSRVGENGLCELVADAFRAVGGTQAALLGAGSVRTNLMAGEVTYKDTVDILPYCNEIILTEVSGQMLLDALEFGVSFLPNQAAAFPQVSGITYRINEEIESSVKMDENKQFISVDGEYRVSDVKVDGKDLDPEAIYTLAITQYLFTGGDGYTMFEGANIYSTTALADNEVVMKYIKENLNGVIPENYAEPQGRVVK